MQPNMKESYEHACKKSDPNSTSKYLNSKVNLLGKRVSFPTNGGLVRIAYIGGSGCSKIPWDIFFFFQGSHGSPPNLPWLTRGGIINFIIQSRGDGCLEIMMTSDTLPCARARARRPRRPRVRVLVLDCERVATVKKCGNGHIEMM